MDTSKPSTQASTAPNSRPIPTRYAQIPPRILAFFRQVRELDAGALSHYNPATWIASNNVWPKDSLDKPRRMDDADARPVQAEHDALVAELGAETLSACFALQFPGEGDERPNPARLDRLDLQAIMTARGELAELHNADELDVAGILALEKLEEILERNDPRTGTTGPRADGPRCKDAYDQAEHIRMATQAVKRSAQRLALDIAELEAAADPESACASELARLKPAQPPAFTPEQDAAFAQDDEDAHAAFEELALAASAAQDALDNMTDDRFIQEPSDAFRDRLRAALAQAERVMERTFEEPSGPREDDDPTAEDAIDGPAGSRR